jgi:outer membrane protein OmpA-like peptidoglycan-associated protein
MHLCIPTSKEVRNFLKASAFRVLLPLVLWAAGAGAAPIFGQNSEASQSAESLRQYTELIMAMLTERVEAAVHLESGRVELAPSSSALLIDCRKLVRGSVPYYLEDEVARFKRFDERVRVALENLDGLQVGAAPDAWTSERWAYYRVQHEIEDVLLLMALDIGAYANSNLQQAVWSTEDLARDWSGMRAGVDELGIEPVDPLDVPTPKDGSTLGGSDTGGNSMSGSNGFDDPTMAILVRVLAGMEAILAELTGSRPGGLLDSTGLDAGWSGGALSQPLPNNLPDEFSVSFADGSAALGLSAEYALNAMIELMALHPQLRVIAEGHSDPVGGERLNMKLSQRRAETVRYYLIAHGIAPDRVVATHWGESKPEWGAGLDRRVVVRLLKH